MGTVAANFLPSTSGFNLGSDSQRWNVFAQSLDVLGISVTPGTGSPEGVVAAPVGCIYIDTAGTDGQVLYVKETGVDEYGWSAKAGESFSASITVDGDVTITGSLVSSAATGTAPIQVSSTTVCPNLNAEKLVGKDWASPDPLGATAPSTVAATTITATTSLAIAGAAALATTAQTGTGSLVMATSPTIAAPTISGAAVFSGNMATSPSSVTLANGANADVNIGSVSFVKIAGPTGAFSVSGFTGGTSGRRLTVYNSVAYAMTITNNATSAAANRILTLTGADVVLSARASVAHFIYDAAQSLWILTGTY